MRSIAITTLFLTLLSTNKNTCAQDLSGTWTGNYSKHFLMTHPRKLVVELSQHNGNELNGASHLYYSGNKYEHYTLSGVFDPKDSTVFFREDSTLSVHLGFGGSNCLGHYDTRLVYTDSSMQLTGTWSDNANGLFRCNTVKVFLEKPLPRPVRRETTAPPKPKDSLQKIRTAGPEPLMPEPADHKKLARAAIIQSLIEVAPAEKDSIRIELYDNKEIDGDIISLYYNDTPVLRKQALTDKPLVLYLSLDPKVPVSKLKMVAESLGSDPPCTAMMKVTTRTGKHYEVNLSGDYSKNSVVDLFLKE